MDEIKKTCKGCGIILQDDNMTQEGYTTDIENDLCQRCFRMKNYGEYQVVAKSNDEYIEILKSIGQTKDLVLYIVDLLNLDRDLSKIREYIPNKILLVLNKRDVLPKSVSDDKIKEYIESLGLNFEDIAIISANKNYNIDILLNKIKKYQTSSKVYIVGNTNVGKSSLINKLLKNYSDNPNELTISPLPSTTLNKITIELSDTITLIDTPGLVDRENLVNYVDSDILKKINPKKEIKPRTYQLKPNQCLIIGNLVRLDYVEGEKNSFTIYVSNSLKVKRMNASKHENLKDLKKTTIDLKYREDIVINGLGWVKTIQSGKVDVYLNKDVSVYTRKSLI